MMMIAMVMVIMKIMVMMMMMRMRIMMMMTLMMIVMMIMIMIMMIMMMMMTMMMMTMMIKRRHVVAIVTSNPVAKLERRHMQDRFMLSLMSKDQQNHNTGRTTRNSMYPSSLISPIQFSHNHH